jgi:tricarballylate dehydrogenase
VAWQLFDRKTIHLLEPRYGTGTPIEADSLDALAAKCGIEPETLQRTVADFNAECRPGEFAPFRKDGLRTAAGALAIPKSNWALPLDAPPYVAYGVTCGITFTYGGLKIDTAAQVIDDVGRPMPGLFATGEIAGGFFFHNYAAGSGLMRGAAFGRIAGTSAAASALSPAGACAS